MSTFSERNGFVEVRSIVQVNELDSDTRTRIWNVLHLVIVRPFENERGYAVENAVLDFLWVHYLRRAVDERPQLPYNCWQMMKNQIQHAQFNEVMDLLELLVESFRIQLGKTQFMYNSGEDFVELINETFEQALVGYRFVDDRLLQVDSAEEVEAIKDALLGAQPLATANAHLTRAFGALTNRDAQDYASVIRESINGVESALRTLTGEEKFSNAIRKLPDLGFPDHKALLGSWEKMYGWSSDEAGLRHGGGSIAKIDQPLAKYVFGAAASFVAYLASEASKLGKL